MLAYIKKDKWEEFKKDYVFYNFSLAPNPNYYIKKIDDSLLLIISRRTRKLELFTQMGTSPFMESHKDKFKDLIDNDFIEYKKSKFD